MIDTIVERLYRVLSVYSQSSVDNTYGVLPRTGVDYDAGPGFVIALARANCASSRHLFVQSLRVKFVSEADNPSFHFRRGAATNCPTNFITFSQVLEPVVLLFGLK